MSKSLRGGRDRLEIDTQNSLMRSFFLSQGNAELQIKILHAHLVRNPDQFVTVTNMISSGSLYEGLDGRIARYLDSGAHKRNGFSDELVHDVLKDTADDLIGLDMNAVPDFLDIGSGILEQDIKYLNGRPRERPTSEYNIFHPRASQFVHYGILYPERSIPRVQSVATSAASAILDHVQLTIGQPDNTHTTYGDLELSIRLSRVLGQSNRQLPQFEDQTQPFIDQANILASRTPTPI